METTIMGPTDVILLLTRWVHAMAGVTWVGGGLFYLLVLQPSLAAAEDQSPLASFKASIAKEFKEIVQLSVMGLAITGTILAFDRLSHGNVSNLYVAILAVKVAAAGVMFVLARPARQKRPLLVRRAKTLPDGESSDQLTSAPRGQASSPQIILALGLLVFFLASLLQVIFEKGI